ncbi:MAG: electron transport complex subunit RsxC [Firmicutes bacterium]|nr:electron transport complex subunit RsxC [Bacillota bacterium]
MRLYKVRGGIAIPDHKEGAHSPLEELTPPAVLTVSLLQHRGASARPVVKRGELVRRGQCIGEPVGLGAPIHSPVSGKVIEVASRLHPSGFYCESVVIENDGEYVDADRPEGIADPTSVKPEVIRRRVHEAGVVGLGGAMFPTSVKLAPEGPVDTLIINGSECEPYLTCDHRVMLECTEDLIYGWQALRYALGAKRVLIAVEANKPDAIAKLKQATTGMSDVEVVTVPAVYPQGAEDVLIRRVTGRRLRARGLPAEVGCMVHNVATVLAVARALRDGEPLIKRAVTVAGSGVQRAANFWVAIGTPAGHLLDHVGRRDDIRQLIFGGPMMGQSVSSEDVPVIKGTNGLLAIAEDDVLEFTTGVCLRCGWCLDVCPVGLEPYHLARLAEAGEWHEAEAAGAMLCYECGSCSYRCPGRRPLLPLIKLAKGEILREQAAARTRSQTSGGVA